ncbi:MAG: substrate-binding domain-containing protein [Bacteroidota bacterium]
MGITTKEIAKLAGVSRGTVDRVLNNRGQVSAEVKARILKIVEDFKYKKNVLASRLAINEPVKIAVVLPDPNNDVFWQAPLEGITKVQSSMTDYGMSLELNLFNLFDSKSYVFAFQQAISSRPSAILLAPIFLKETLSLIQMAEQNGIPIVCINSEIDSKDVLSFIGQDSLQSGIIAGKLFHLNSSVNNQIVAITQGHDAKNAIHIKKKLDGLKQYNFENQCDFEIVDIQVKDFFNPGILQKEVDLLLSNPSNLRGIFFTNSRAYNMINQTDLADRLLNSATIIGYDLLDQNVELLKQQKIDFLLHQKPELQGYQSVLSLFNHFIHKKTIDQKQYLPIDIVVKENVDSYLQERDRMLEMML